MNKTTNQNGQKQTLRLRIMLDVPEQAKTEIEAKKKELHPTIAHIVKSFIPVGGNHERSIN